MGFDVLKYEEDYLLISYLLIEKLYRMGMGEGAGIYGYGAILKSLGYLDTSVHLGTHIHACI